MSPDKRNPFDLPPELVYFGLAIGILSLAALIAGFDSTVGLVLLAATIPTALAGILYGFKMRGRK